MSNHTAIHGPAGAGRTETVQFLLDEDLVYGRESWVIDPAAGAIGDWADRAGWVATDSISARRMLSAAYATDETVPVTITIEAADKVLADAPCQVLTRQAMRRPNVTVRFVVPDLTLHSFGGSEWIRTEVEQGSLYATRQVA